MNNARLVAIALLALTLPLLVSSVSAADRVRVFVFAEPDPALGGLVSTALLDSVDDFKDLLGRRLLGWGGLKNTNTRADATMLVQVLSRTVDASDAYSVRVRVTFDGQTHEFTGTDVRQWKRCILPIAAALSELANAQRTATATRPNPIS